MIGSNFKVLLFTGSYPYRSSAAEDTFIEPELSYLKSSFGSVVIIPKYVGREETELPNGILIETTLGKLLKPSRAAKSKIKNFLLVFTFLDFYNEIKKKQIRSIIRIIDYFGVALRTKIWAIKYIENNNIDLTKTIFYTYWLDEITMGICLAKRKYPSIKIVSRAHRADLYEEIYDPPFIPFRPEIFSGIDKIFLASESGKSYLSLKYPDFDAIFTTSRLGVSEQKSLTIPSEDNVFRLVSCSYLVSVKRIELLIRGLAELGKNRKDQIFEWVHIGDGPLRSELEHMAGIQLPQNVKFTFLGFLPKGGVISFYQNNKIEVFINVSSSEGTPVSIMEAQSCSIPVIATGVGGNPEIVTNDNGILLSENPEPGEIADAICILLDDRTLIQDKKKKSYENWDKKYNSEKNLQSFVKDLVNILKNNKKS